MAPTVGLAAIVIGTLVRVVALPLTDERRRGLQRRGFAQLTSLSITAQIAIGPRSGLGTWISGGPAGGGMSGGGTGLMSGGGLSIGSGGPGKSGLAGCSIMRGRVQQRCRG